MPRKTRRPKKKHGAPGGSATPTSQQSAAGQPVTAKKKQQPKKQQPKKQQPKKQQPKKQQPNKQQPNKQQPKKQQPNKQQPKKQQPKKQQPKNQQPKKQQPKNQQPKNQQQENKEEKEWKAKNIKKRSETAVASQVQSQATGREGPPTKKRKKSRDGSLVPQPEAHGATDYVAGQKPQKSFVAETWGDKKKNKKHKHKNNSSLASKADRTIFLSELPRNPKKEHIMEYYSSIAKDAVQSIRWRPAAIRSAYVVFRTSEYAAKALEMPGPTLRNRLTTVQKFDPSQIVNTKQVANENSTPNADKSEEAKSMPQQPAATKETGYKWHSQEREEEPKQKFRMFLGKCPDTIQDEDIYDYYSSISDDCITDIIWARQFGRFCGYGFVIFKDAASLDRALSMPPPQVDGRTLAINPAGYKPSPFQLFIGGLKGTGKTTNDVRKYYEELLGPGAITGNRELLEKDGTSKGAGFLAFSSKAAMEKALNVDPPRYGYYPVKIERTGQKSPGTKTEVKGDQQLMFRKVPPNVTDEDFISHYSTLAKTAVMRVNWVTNDKRRTAYVVFSSPDIFQKAVQLGPPVVDFHVLTAEVPKAKQPK